MLPYFPSLPQRNLLFAESLREGNRFFPADKSVAAREAIGSWTGFALRLRLPSGIRFGRSIEPDEIPADGKRIGGEVTELLEYKPEKLYIRRVEELLSHKWMPQA